MKILCVIKVVFVIIAFVFVCIKTHLVTKALFCLPCCIKHFGGVIKACICYFSIDVFNKNTPKNSSTVLFASLHFNF